MAPNPTARFGTRETCLGFELTRFSPNHRAGGGCGDTLRCSVGRTPGAAKIELRTALQLKNLWWFGVSGWVSGTNFATGW